MLFTSRKSPRLTAVTHNYHLLRPENGAVSAQHRAAAAAPARSMNGANEWAAGSSRLGQQMAVRSRRTAWRESSGGGSRSSTHGRWGRLDSGLPPVSRSRVSALAGAEGGGSQGQRGGEGLPPRGRGVYCPVYDEECRALSLHSDRFPGWAPVTAVYRRRVFTRANGQGHEGSGEWSSSD